MYFGIFCKNKGGYFVQHFFYGNWKVSTSFLSSSCRTCVIWLSKTSYFRYKRYKELKEFSKHTKWAVTDFIPPLGTQHHMHRESGADCQSYPQDSNLGRGEGCRPPSYMNIAPLFSVSRLPGLSLGGNKGGRGGRLIDVSRQQVPNL